MEPGEGVAAVVPIREFVEGADLLTCTRNGKVKRTSLEAYSNIRVTGIIGVAIEEGDALLAARIVQERPARDDRHGPGHVDSLRGRRGAPHGSRHHGREGHRAARGRPRGRRRRASRATSSRCSRSARNGYGKRTPIGEWRVQGRGGLGIIAMDTSERNGELVRLCLVRADDQLMCVTDAGVVIRTRCSRDPRGRPQHPGRARDSPGRERAGRRRGADRSQGRGGETPSREDGRPCDAEAASSERWRDAAATPEPTRAPVQPMSRGASLERRAR